MAGLYPNSELVERWVSGAITAQSVSQPFIAPCDLEVIGLMLHLGTAPGGSNSISVNISDSPTSQLSSGVTAYNLWTAANVPTLSGTATFSPTTATSTSFGSTGQSLIANRPYALNYPFPGPSGQSGFVTAQSTAQTTETPVTTPPVLTKYYLNSFVAPDNTYQDANYSVTGVLAAASIVHEGDVLTFVISGASPGSANGLELLLYCQIK